MIFGAILGEGLGKGAIALLLTAGIYFVVITTLMPNLPNIIFWSGPEGERMEELVEPDMMSYIVGADERRIWLHNNPEAKNPTWDELLKFLRNDDTDQHAYDINSFVCADFAEMLHNNAEKAGIRAAFVTVQLEYDPFFNITPRSSYFMGRGHALNAFQTIDRGILYMDCTGSKQGGNADKTVDVEVGRDYIPRSLFPEPGWSAQWGNVGKVLSIATKW